MHHSLNNIIQKGRAGNATEEQRQEYLSLFHKPEAEFELKNQMLDELDRTEAVIENKPFFDEIFEQIWRKRKIELRADRPKKLNLIRFVQWAAVLAVGLFAGYYLNTVRQTSAPVFYTSVAPRGSISETYLPDGTHIFLNSGTEIKYSVDGHEGKREIYLSGEAWFQVAKMKEKPFVVHTSFYDVQVTGTTFNIKAYSGEKKITTTLEEGSVRVKSSENLRLDEETVLKPGQQLVYNTDTKNVQVNEVNTKWFTAWKDSKLVFVNMSLQDLKTLLERKYGVEIEITDQDILKYHYDGTFKDETIIEVLEILKHTLPVEYQIVDQKVVIRKKK